MREKYWSHNDNSLNELNNLIIFRKQRRRPWNTGNISYPEWSVWSQMTNKPSKDSNNIRELWKPLQNIPSVEIKIASHFRPVLKRLYWEMLNGKLENDALIRSQKKVFRPRWMTGYWIIFFTVCMVLSHLVTCFVELCWVKWSVNLVTEWSMWSTFLIRHTQKGLCPPNACLCWQH